MSIAISSLIKKRDYKTTLENNFPYYFLGCIDENTPKLTQAIIDVISEEFVNSETDITSFNYSETIANATGIELDKWGRLIGETPRYSSDDDLYRRFILASFFAYTTIGSYDELRYLTTILTQSDDIVISRVGEYGIEISFKVEVLFSGIIRSRIYNIIKRSIPLGHELVLAQGLPTSFRFNETHADPVFFDRILG